MYWSIVGTRGDLLGYSNLKYNNVTIVDTNVSIVQEAGWTSLRITEAIAGGNGIEKVICFTYGTQVALATAKIVTQTNPLLKTNSFQPIYVLIIVFLLIVIIVCVIIIIIIISYFKFFQKAKEDKGVNSKPSQAQNDLHADAVYHSID